MKPEKHGAISTQKRSSPICVPQKTSCFWYKWLLWPQTSEYRFLRDYDIIKPACPEKDRLIPWSHISCQKFFSKPPHPIISLDSLFFFKSSQSFPPPPHPATPSLPLRCTCPKAGRVKCVGSSLFLKSQQHGSIALYPYCIYMLITSTNWTYIAISLKQMVVARLLFVWRGIVSVQVLQGSFGWGMKDLSIQSK